MNPKCDKCKHRRMYYNNYPCIECTLSDGRVKPKDYFDSLISNNKNEGAKDKENSQTG